MFSIFKIVLFNFKGSSSQSVVQEQPKRPSSVGALDSQNSEQTAPARSTLVQFPRIQTGKKFFF